MKNHTLNTLEEIIAAGSLSDAWNLQMDGFNLAECRSIIKSIESVAHARERAMRNLIQMRENETDYASAK